MLFISGCKITSIFQILQVFTSKYKKVAYFPLKSRQVSPEKLLSFPWKAAKFSLKSKSVSHRKLPTFRILSVCRRL